MKIKYKLILATLSISILPIFILLLICSNVYSSQYLDYQFDSVKQTLDNQAQGISNIFEDSLLNVKSLSTREETSELIKNSNKGEDVKQDILDFIGRIEDLELDNPSFVDTIVINQNGIIVASTDSERIGKKADDIARINKDILNKNGLSDFYSTSYNDYSVPVYDVSKSIYTVENEKIGIVCSTYDVRSIQTNLSNYETRSTMSYAMIDSEKKVLSYPDGNIYNSVSEMGGFYLLNDDIANLEIPNENYNILNNVLLREDTNNKSYFCITPITNKNWENVWYLVSRVDKSLLDGGLDKTETYSMLVFGALFVLIIIAAIFYSNRFVAPINDIMYVIGNKKNNGHADFNINTTDEFRDIGIAFNKLYDDIYESEQRYRTIVEMTDNITFEINNKKGTVFVSRNFNKKFGLRPKNDTLKESFIYNFRVHKDDKAQYRTAWDNLLGPVNHLNGEYRIKSIYGDFIWVRIKCTKFYGRDDKPAKIIGVIVDIDREKKSEIKLIAKASYDNLTQLYNRETFLNSLTNEVELANSKKSLDAVMFIDLDDFKFFNDEYGHACGDEVLKFVADVLKEITFERGFSGRFGGDEFIICVVNLTVYGDAGKIAQEIIDLLTKGFYSESTDQMLSIKCSVGIAFIKESGKTTNEIVAAADEAMYAIKKHGKSDFAYAKSIKYTDSDDDLLLDEETVLPVGKPIDNVTTRNT